MHTHARKDAAGMGTEYAYTRAHVHTHAHKAAGTGTRWACTHMHMHSYMHRLLHYFMGFCPFCFAFPTTSPILVLGFESLGREGTFPMGLSQTTLRKLGAGVKWRLHLHGTPGSRTAPRLAPRGLRRPSWATPPSEDWGHPSLRGRSAQRAD